MGLTVLKRNNKQKEKAEFSLVCALREVLSNAVFIFACLKDYRGGHGILREK